jgi:hypothetical protein
VRRALILLAAVGACYPSTTRPNLTPLPDATRLEMELTVPQATRALALALHADSFPVARTEPEDGWLETEWFNGVSMLPTGDRSPGIDVVKLRAFIAPGRANHSILTVELVYRPVANPSLPERELEAITEPFMPITGRLKRLLDLLAES